MKKSQVVRLNNARSGSDIKCDDKYLAMNMTASASALKMDPIWEELPRRNGVYQLSDSISPKEQENLYVEVRGREGRLYSDDLVKKLPLINKDDPYFEEWELRLIAVMRLHKYLVDKERAMKILDIGCGNGWMANLMTQVLDSQVFGIDINQFELEQAARLFGDNPRLTLAYCDIREDPFPEKELDTIILAATIQYFPDLEKLIGKLFDYLKPGGEIHIIDSPIYTSQELSKAKQQTLYYYTQLEVPEMAQRFTHHTFRELEPFHSRILYDPTTWINRLRRKVMSSADSPFPWVMIKNMEEEL